MASKVIQKKRKAKIYMCNALEELVNEGFQKGFQEGFQLQKEKLLRGCIRAGKENDVDEETVIKVISEEFSM